MFHSVGLESHPWTWSHISESLESFEAKIAALKSNGFTGVHWRELYDYMAGRRDLPKDSILLTFDDGYLDNWTYVFPILKKYDLKGTIFVNPDFVDPRLDLRPNLHDVNKGRCSIDQLCVAGFLSWAEMREMEKSGLIDVQSHAMTHTWYFSGPKIVDFHRPHTIAPHPWLFWNACPSRKPFYLVEDQQEFVPWGYPIFEHQKSLVCRRFFPDEKCVVELTGFVADNGGKAFFQTPDWRQAIEEVLPPDYATSGLPGRYESDAERESRVTDELYRSKTLIENNLNKRAEFICWPGGANDESVHEIARRVGYRSWTLDSRSQLEKRNSPGEDPETIRRMGTGNQIFVKDRYCGTGGAYFQVLKVLAHQGSRFHKAVLRVYQLVALARSLGGSKE